MIAQVRGKGRVLYEGATSGLDAGTWWRVSGGYAMPESLGRAWESGGILYMAPPTQPHWEGAAQSVNLSAPSRAFISLSMWTG